MSLRRRLTSLLLAALTAAALPAVAQADPAERSPAAGFRNPVKESAADPQMAVHNGFYYLTYTRNDHIAVTKARSVTELATAPETTVWTDKNPARCCDMWAPELHFLNGNWYIYYTATDNTHAVGNHRMYVLESKNPLGPYRFKGALAAASDQYSLDGTILKMPDNRLYAIWSGWDPGTTAPQNLYIAAMTTPWTTSGRRVKLATPEYDWEKDHAAVNEGAAVLWHGNQLYVAYSASGCSSPNYALGLLTFTGNDVLNPKAWQKSPQPAFKSSPENVAFSTAHNSFFISPDGTETWMAYHGVTNPNGSCGGDRATRIQKVNWQNDTPDFGTPAATWHTQTLPSGDPGAARVPDGDYVLTADHSGKVLDVAEASQDDGADVLQWDYNGGEHQIWQLHGQPDGTYELSATHSDKQLTVEQPADDGADVVQSSSHQRWYMDAVQSGYRVSTQTTGRALDVDHASTANGANVLVWQYLYGPNQKWRLAPVNRIMPLGDSITYGSADGITYRTELWLRLRNAAGRDGWLPNMVGSVVTGQLTDQEHEGHPGFRIDEISANITGWLTTARPDTVLLHIGTNDMNQNFDVTNAPARLSALIDQILQTAPGTRIIVASIIPASDPAIEARIQAYNAAIPDIVRTKQAAGQNVSYVDMHAALTTADLADTLHPNKTGYNKMGVTWAKAVGK